MLRADWARSFWYPFITCRNVEGDGGNRVVKSWSWAIVRPELQDVVTAGVTQTDIQNRSFTLGYKPSFGSFVARFVTAVWIVLGCAWHVLLLNFLLSVLLGVFTEVWH